MTPEAIGRYRILRRVGAGGMGVVYEALDERLRERVALKVLLPHAAEQADGLLRFKREFRALARLRHPSVVRVLDAGIEDDVPFIAMEFVTGKDIRRHIAALPEGPVRERELGRCLREILGALGHIHARRIVHRDLKPENIFVCEDGRVKLMDFGVARLRPTESGESGLLGTFAYMSPEQVKGGELDGRSDLYAVGVLVYELLVGAYPFPVEPPAAALHHHVHTVPDPIRAHVPRADPRLADLSARLMEKDPLERLQSAEAALAFLGEPESALFGGESSAPGQLFAPRLAGREAELERLLELAEGAARGRGRMVLVEGPSGIGKTRLVQELALRLRSQRCVLHGQCQPEGGQAYGVFEGILDEAAAVIERASPEIGARIVGDDAGWVAPVSPRLARLGAAIGAEPLDPQARQVALRKAIVGIVGRLALPRPLVIIMEDVQWADPASLELLRDFSRTLFHPKPGASSPEATVCPLLLVLTRRSLVEGRDEAEELMRRLERKGRVDRLRLGPLGEAAVGQMLETTTGEAEPRSGVIEELHRVTRGRPLLVLEMLEAWVQEGLLTRSGGRWRFRGRAVGSRAAPAPPPPPPRGPSAARDGGVGQVAPPPRAAAPPKEELAPRAPSERRVRRPRPARGDDVALAKLERASAGARELLERLALLGRLVPGALAAGVNDLEEEVFLDAVDEAVRAKLLVEDVGEREVTYRFYHEGFREAVVRSLSSSRKQALHDDIARRLERRFGARRRERAHVLARHFRSGSRPSRAVRYLVATAGEAERRGDLDGAWRRLREALELLEREPRTPARVARWVRVRSAEIDLLLDFGRVEAALERAEPDAGFDARSPPVAESELRVRRAAARLALGDLDAALDELELIERPWPTRSVGARVKELEGRARLARGELGEARLALEEARLLATEAGMVGLAERIEAKLGVVSLERGELERALERLESALEPARRRGDDRTVVELLGHIGIIQSRRGNGSEARASFRSAMELAEARGFARELERWTGELGRQLVELGDEAGAFSCLERALELAEETRHGPGRARWRVELGALRVARGEAEAAVAPLEEALELARAARLPAVEGLALVALAAAVGARAPAEAHAHLDAAQAVAAHDASVELEVLARLGRAHLDEAAGKLERAERERERAEARAREAEDSRLLERVRRSRGAKTPGAS